MPKADSVIHMQILCLRSFAELRCLLKFSGGKLMPSYLFMERGGAGYLDGAAGYSHVGSESDDKEGRAKDREPRIRKGKLPTSI